MDKKMTKDEAKKAADEWAEIYHVGTGTALEGNVYVAYDRGRGVEIARFPFEPPRCELTIGDTHRFSNSDNDDWCIGQLKNHNLNPTHGNHFQASNGWWYGECEPYTLVDPAEHAELKKRAVNLTEQVKATAEDIQPLRAERDRLRREVKSLQSELVDPEEHAKAKQAEAVLDEILPLCEKLVKEECSYEALRVISKLGQLLK